MPATETPSVTAVENPEAAASVLDVSLFDSPQRTVKYLEYAGLLQGNDAIMALGMAKRLNQAAYAREKQDGIPDLQAAFRQALAVQPDVAKLTEGGAESPVFKLVDGYLSARANHYQRVISELDALPSDLGEEMFNRTRHEAEAQKRKYEQEQAFYRSNPAVVNDAAAKYPQALTAGKFLPLGRLAIETGIIAGDRDKISDMIDDALANAASHSFLHMADEIMTTADADIELNKRFPERYRANILAKADDTAATTVALDKVEPFLDSSPELARVQSLKALLSAQLNAMTAHTRNADGSVNPPVEGLAESMAEIKPLVRKYQSAAMSLAYHFLGEGPGKDDARMQTLRTHLEGMMEKERIPLLLDREEAARTASQLAQETAAYLGSKHAGRPEALAKLDQLLAQVSPAQVQQPEQALSMAEKYATAPGTGPESRIGPSSTSRGVAA